MVDRVVYYYIDKVHAEFNKKYFRREFGELLLKNIIPPANFYR